MLEPEVRPSRLRPVAFAVLVALVPTAVAGWAVGRSAAQDARRTASEAVVGELQQASRVSDERHDQAEATAKLLARSPEIQRAFIGRRTDVLAAFARRHPRVSFSVRGVDVPATRPPAAVTGAAAVTLLGGKRIGVVRVAVPRATLLATLRKRVALEGQDRLLLAPPGLASARPRDIRLGGRTYRAAGAPISGQVEVVVARPTSVIDEDVRNVWLTMLGAVLATLATVAFIAWATAPLVARGRIAHRERSEALQVLSHLRDGVFFTDLEGVIRFWNRAAERITGLSRRQVWGRPLSSLPGLAELDIPVGEEEDVRAQTLPVQVGTRELWLSVAGVKVEEGVVYTFGDVTDEQRFEQLKSDFLSTVSHELRTPLAGLYGAAVTLQERGDRLSPGVRSQLFTTVSEQSEHLIRIVEDVLVASGLEADRLPLVRERFDAVALAQDVVEEERVRNSTARVQLEETESAYAVGDPARTRQVLENLIDNALKYASSGPVRVAVERGRESVVFSVSDEGPGIAEEERERIFEKFYRSDVQMQSGIGGTGLGLYICRELVQRMGGRLWLDSTPGAGSLFLFELPSIS